MIEAAPFDNHAALAIFARLDHSDWLEAQAVRGGGADHLDLFGDWRGAQAAAILSLVLRDQRRGGEPFALLILGNTGQAGVAQAAMLARCHQTFRRAIAAAAVQIRRDMPVFCDDAGIHRVEVRCWDRHPTAPDFLFYCGFEFEANLPGFGAGGADRFLQFAWTNRKDP